MNYWLHVFMLMGIWSVPAAITSVMFSFTFWGISWKPLWKPILAFAFLQSLAVDLLFLKVPLYMRPLNFFAAFILLFIVFFRSFSIKLRFLISIFAIIAYMLAESVGGTLLNHFFPHEEVLQSPLLLAATFWPLLVAGQLLRVLMERKQYFPGQHIRAFIRESRDRKVPFLLFFIASQAVLIMLAVVFKDLGKYDPLFIDTLLIMAAAISIFALLLVLQVVSQTRNDAVKMTQQLYIEDINRMFTTVRGQRHDFLNHVQVISSFVKRRKWEELERYTQELVGEITEVNDMIRIGNPALAALIQAKAAVAIDRKIRFAYDCSDVESTSLGLKSVDLVKVIGNLLDNAFDEAMKLPVSERFVELQCRSEQKRLHITVKNRGSFIPEETQRNMFLPGFSTKSGEHQGLGLSIVKERLDYYKGTIEVESSPKGGTIFRLSIPQSGSVVSN